MAFTKLFLVTVLDLSVSDQEMIDVVGIHMELYLPKIGCHDKSLASDSIQVCLFRYAQVT